MKTIAITVSGGFHNMGDITLRAKIREVQRHPSDPAGPGRCLIAELNDRQLDKIYRHMCGMSDCRCGGGYGDVWEAPDGWERTGAAEWALDLPS